MLKEQRGQRKVLSLHLLLKKRVILLRFLQHGDSSINNSPHNKKAEECLTVTEDPVHEVHSPFLFSSSFRSSVAQQQ